MVGGNVDPSCVDGGDNWFLKCLFVRGSGGGISTVDDDCVGIFILSFICFSTRLRLRVAARFFLCSSFNDVLSLEPDTSSLEPDIGSVGVGMPSSLWSYA